MKLKSFFVLLQLFLSVNSYMKAVVNSDLFKCDGYDIDGGAIDFSNFEYIPFNDTHTFVNGTWKFLIEVKSPWKFRAYTERKYGSIWSMTAFDRTYKDFCAILNNPLEPVYPFTKDQPKCPIPAGTEWKWDMQQVILDPVIRKRIPKDYEGEWRAFGIGTYIVGEKTLQECRKGNADLYWDYTEDGIL
ncbi:hypothetical protein PVAND_011028 [Polypedilum vanderplanki]|uniref:Uncharacterized protein n=1 Tax=Polypedilum vanderplanki TaxID=319348 RepID=A0A9J6CHW0_POLVA|nr:hypothetical protein PVAND_011028 [Polypedilum vanderplanki]